jgi:hypothetical protein
MKAWMPAVALVGCATFALAQVEPPPDDAGLADGGVIVIELENGTRLRGDVVRETADGLVLDSELLGEVTLKLDDIRERLPADAKLSPRVVEDPPPPGLFGTGILEGFDKSISLGVSGREAESSDLTLNVAAEADFNGPDRRWRFRSAYFYGTSDGDRTQDEAFANLRRDWKLPDEPPFIFAEGRGQYDDFQTWRTRLGGFAGIGYAIAGDVDEKAGRWPIVDDEKLELIGRIGAGGSYEFGQVNEFVPEALLAIEVGYRIGDDKTFRLVNTLFPDLDDFGESRNTSELSLKLLIDEGQGLSLSVGGFNEYLSRTDGESPHNSLRYFVRLVYDF